MPVTASQLGSIPLGVPRRKTSVLGARTSQTLDLGAVADVLADDVRRLARDITVATIEEQERADNKALNLMIDGFGFRRFSEMRSRAVTNFDGGSNIRPALDAVMRAASRAPLAGISWTWASPDPELAAAANGAGPVRYEFGSAPLWLIPRGRSEIWLPRMNQLVMDARAVTQANLARARGRPQSARRSKGWFAQTSAAMNRNPAVRDGGVRVFAKLSEVRSRTLGRPTGFNPLGSNRVSTRTGKLPYYQGIPYFVLRAVAKDLSGRTR